MSKSLMIHKFCCTQCWAFVKDTLDVQIYFDIVTIDNVSFIIYLKLFYRKFILQSSLIWQLVLGSLQRTLRMVLWTSERDILYFNVKSRIKEKKEKGNVELVYTTIGDEKRWYL